MKRSDLFECLRCMFIFFVIYEFAMLFRLNPNQDSLSAFFPAPAFIVAITYMQGLRAFPCIFLAATTASFTNYPPWDLTEFNWLHITRQTVIYTLAGLALNKCIPKQSLQFSHIETVWRFVMISLVATAGSALLACALFYGFGFVPTDNLHHIFVSFLVGDLTGLLMFAPLAFALEFYRQERMSLGADVAMLKRITLNQMGGVLLAIAASLAIFTLVISEPAWSYFHYLVIIPVALVAVKYGVKAAIAAAFIINILSASIYNLLNADLYSMVEIQMLYAVTALIALLLGAYHDNQKAVSEKLRDNQLMLANLAQKSSLSELSSTIAHEVASPLQAALMNSQMSIQLLQSGQHADRNLLLELNQDVEFALNKAVQIHRRIYKGVVANKTLQVEDVNVRDCFRDTQRLLSELIAKNNIQFSNAECLTDIWVHADRLSLTQVLVNVVKNAIQADATRISFSVSLKATMASIDVHNNGEEISNEVQAKMFQALFSTKKEGMGLGLAICRTMLEGFGGNITLLTADKNAQTLGATFRITLPKGASQ